MNDKDIFKSAYIPEQFQSKFHDAGYEFLPEYSNRHNQAYLHKENNRILFNVAGTHEMGDWGTDIMLAAGRLKSTDRYHQSKELLDAAKREHGTNADIYGHSLGGSIAGYIAGKDDTVHTLDKGATFGQQIRENEIAIRREGDLVSFLNSANPRMKTVKYKKANKGWVSNILAAHAIDDDLDL